MAGSPRGIVPYILIPVIALILLLLYLRRKTGIKVTVFKVKEFTSARDKRTRYKYTCGYYTEVIVKVDDDTGPEMGSSRMGPRKE